jgi:nitrogen-specific signal transduction histidine kinase/CheY-like chemotaxis protein
VVCGSSDKPFPLDVSTLTNSPAGPQGSVPDAASAFADEEFAAGTILGALPAAVAVLDEQGRIAYANGAAVGLLGEAWENLLGRHLFREVLPVPETGETAHPSHDAAESGNPSVVGVRLPGAQGEQRFRLHLRALAGTTRGWTLVVIEDCTEELRERERRERAERLAAVGELAAGVAHEVNNPLASIKSFAQLLARDATGREQREALELIINESTRVAGIVENLLSFARQQGAGGRERINLSAVAERVLHMQRYALDTAGIKVRRDFDASLSPVMGEVGALQQVILNLIVNAEQALASKDGERLLIVRTRESTEGVILAVVDNGPGIPREILPHVFERFRTTKAGGTGLGLAISSAIVRDHAGQIWAESDEGRGAAFYVSLPRASGTAPQPEPETVQPAVDSSPVRSLRVLVADDEPALRLAISLFLTRRGHAVVQAADAYEALDLAKAQPFDVALVDARMPGDGLALLEQLEEVPTLRGRTALMTGDLGRARTRQGIATGRPYLTKPFDMDEMVNLLETLGR